MDQLLSFLDPGWVGVLVGTLGLGFGIYQLLRRTGGRLAYQYMGQLLIEGGGGLLPNELVVQYEGQPIPRVSQCQMVIWNKGRSPVRGEDIIAEHPIRFSFGDGAEILKVEIVRVTRVPNDSRSTVEAGDRRFVRFDFSFLDRNDGALLRVLHTGSRQKPRCTGTIIGLPKGVEYLGRIPIILPSRLGMVPISFRRTVARTWKILLMLPPIVGLMSIAVAVYPRLFFILLPSTPNDVSRIPFVIVGIIYLFPLFFVWFFRRRFPSTLMPEEFDYGSEERKEASEPE